MSNTRTEFPTTEGILLIRQNGTTMAVHLTAVQVIMEAVVHEHPDTDLGYVTHYRSTLGHYEVEANGQADRLYVWTGADPFAKPELDAPRKPLAGDVS